MENMCGIKMFSAQDICKGLHVTKETAYAIMKMKESGARYVERIHSFEDGNGRTGRLLINYELLKNNLPPVVISKEDRVKYFEFLKNNDSNRLAEWLKILSTREEERMKKFGYKK